LILKREAFFARNRKNNNPVLEERTPPMQDSNLFGLLLATLVAPEFREIDEELRRIREEVGEQMTQTATAFLAQGGSPQTTFQFEEELERLLREIGRQTLETVFNRLEPEDPENLPKHFTYQQQEYSRKQEKTNNRNGIGTRFGTIQLRRFSCEPLQEAREDGQKSFAPLEWQLGIVGGNATRVQSVHSMESGGFCIDDAFVFRFSYGYCCWATSKEVTVDRVPHAAQLGEAQDQNCLAALQLPRHS